MKKVLIGLGAAVALLLVAAVVVPSFIDWNAYKPEISAQVEKALGRKLTIEGDIDLSLLPSPALAVSGVRLANIQGARNADMVRLEELRVKVGLGDLLGGRIAVDSVTLQRPVIALEVLPDGRASWDFLPAAEAEQPKETVPAEAPNQGPAQGKDIDFALQSLRIEDGTVLFRDAAGSEQRVEALDAEISAGSLAGPFRMEGEASIRGVPVTLDIAVGEAGRNGGTIPVDLNVSLDGKKARVAFVGAASALAPDATLTGKLTVEAENAAAAMNALSGGQAPVALAQPFQLDSEVSASADIVGLNNLVARLGDLQASGAVNAALGEMPVVDVALNATNLDLDALLAKASPAGDGGAAGKEPAKSSGQQGQGAPPAAEAAGFALPRGMQVALDLNAEIVRYRGGVIRNLALAGNLADGAFTVTKAGAELPGGTPITANGVLQAVQGQPRFDGAFNSRSSDLRGLLAWAGVEVGAVPADRLRQMQAEGKLSASPASVELADATVVVDTTTLRAGAVVPLTGRPAVGLRIAADAVNLDAYLPASAKAGGQPATPAGGPGAQAPSASPAPAASSPMDALADFDANMAVSVETLTLRGERIRKLNADVQLVSGQITIRELSVADFAGLAGKVNGSVKPLAEQPSVSLDFDITANDAARAFRFAGATPPAPADRLGRLSATGTLRGSLESAALRGSVNALGGSVGVDGTVQNPLMAPAVDMAVALNHPELTKLLAAFDYRPAAAQLGPLALKLRVKTGGDAVSLSDIDGSIGPVAVQGTASADLTGARPMIRANLKTSDIQLDPLLPRGPGSRASLEETAGTLFGGEGIVLAQAGGSRIPWTDEKIDFAALREADADIDMAMAGFGVGAMQIEKPILRAVLKDGRLAIQRFAGSVGSGTVEVDGQIDGAAAMPAVALNFVAKQVDLAKLAPGIANFQISIQNALQLGGTASGTGNLSGNIAASGHSTRALVQSLNGKGRVDGILNANLNEQTRGTTAALGIAGAILGQQVRELQGVTAPAQYAQKLAATFQGQNKFNGDFAIANGRLRTDNLLVDSGDGRVLTRGTADLPGWQIDMLSEIYAAGEQQPGLTIQHYGWLDEPNRRFGGSLIQRKPAAAAPAPSAPSSTGQGSATQQRQQQSPQPAPATPKDALRNLLKGLGGGG